MSRLWTTDYVDELNAGLENSGYVGSFSYEYVDMGYTED